MKFTLFGRLAKLKGRINKYVKKTKDTRRFILLMIASMLIVPVFPVSAADKPVSVQNAPTTVTLSYTDVLATAQPRFEVEVQQSSYQQKVAAASKAKQVLVVKVAVSRAEPTLEEKRAWVARAASAYGIPANILEAVWQIESGKQWYTTVRSYAGAQGPCQFMPGTWRGYAQDGNGDGVKDVYDARDCLFGSAKLLAANGAAAGDIKRALFAYNHSWSYVSKVLSIAESI